MPPIRSYVWKHFSKESCTDVRCQLCCKTLKCSNNTTNMMQHLNLKQKLKIPPSINLEMVVMDNLPFSHVEGKGFLQLMKHQYPLYKVPTRNTIKAEIEKMYNREVEKCTKMLSHVSNICLTTDIWTDTQMNSMSGVTVHGLFESKKFYGTIGVFKLTQAHTAAHISEVLKGSLSEFSINKSNVSAVVTDNGANIVKSIYNTFGKNHHIPCFAHTLNLICDSSLNTPEVSNIITSCRAIVTWFKRHVKANDNLRQLQISAGISEGKQLKLILAVKTRRNST
ncbi:uncharacterized protein LOC129242048 [Anastrepha obliqua]|uniref:uncharacterized protein LOC129242048 n=1 Tax=Anastrepha obliqua TaxID=95512 RepID=UPI002409E4BD|nr:uncharacterized protein LOC129242048 [Anastrepha obliqua]